MKWKIRGCLPGTRDFGALNAKVVPTFPCIVLGLDYEAESLGTALSHEPGGQSGLTPCWFAAQ